jgi:hypothetical protein
MVRLLAALIAMVSLAGTAAAAPRGTLNARSAALFDHKQPKCQASPSGPGLLLDGDFDRMPDIGSQYSEYFKGEPFAPGWHVTKGSIDFNGSTGWGPAAPNNACTVDLDGIDPGGLTSRGFATTPNSAYTVTFLFSGNGGEPPQIKRMLVEAAGRSHLFTWDLSQGDAEGGEWSTESWDFTAVSSSTTVTFVSRDRRTSSRGAVIGDISVTQD